MARIARVVAVDYPHHLTQRGNNRQAIFNDDEDRRKYLSFIDNYSRKYKLTILAYCLMPNHVHFIGVPEKLESLAKTFNFAHMRYAQCFNKKTRSCGHLWQGRFYSCILDEGHLLMAARYIECNPIRAAMVKKAWEWKWSSAGYHIGVEKNSIIRMGNLFDYIDFSQREWKEYLQMAENDKVITKLRKYTKTGLPLGTEEFVKKLEAKVGKTLRFVPRGRPWNKK